MSQNTLTHRDLAELLGVSETTVKSYRRKFPGCIPVASQGKPIRFSPEAAKVALRIRDLFELGMSVEEVRLRLSGEFSWVPAEGPKGAPREKSGEAAPELSVGVSNMAKSMVAMNQQQKSMLERMKGIEHMLAELGLQGPFDGEGLRRKSAEAARERETRLEERLDNLDAATQELAGTVASLADQLGRFLGARARAKEERLNGSPAEGRTAGQENTREDSPGHARVIPLRPAADPLSQDCAPGGAFAVNSSAASSQAEPNRRFFTLPLGIRTPEGEHVNPRGRGRGPFSLNDLKAMLIYGHTPPNHFTLRWEPYGQGWWLTLEQAAQDRVFGLLLMEVADRKGGTVVEILQLRNNGEAVHPAEIKTIIDSLGE